MKVDGQCHCGAIAFEAQVEPGTLRICHCNDCQTQSGSAFRANISAPAAGFRLLRGTPRTYIKTAASGSRRSLAFCETCGTPLYACAAENPDAYSLRSGTLTQRV
ncbi:MAG: GFA family protein, partial [Comamonadaceae bacterium]